MPRFSIAKWHVDSETESTETPATTASPSNKTSSRKYYGATNETSPERTVSPVRTCASSSCKTSLFVPALASTVICAPALTGTPFNQASFSPPTTVKFTLPLRAASKRVAA